MIGGGTDTKKTVAAPKPGTSTALVDPHKEGIYDNLPEPSAVASARK